MVTEPQTSWAMATPVTFVRVSPGHSSTRFAGSVNAGGVVSRTVMVCGQLDLLRQASVAVQVRVISFVPPQSGVTESAYVTVGVPQLSVAVAVPVAAGKVLAPHSTV